MKLTKRLLVLAVLFAAVSVPMVNAKKKRVTTIATIDCCTVYVNEVRRVRRIVTGTYTKPKSTEVDYLKQKEGAKIMYVEVVVQADEASRKLDDTAWRRARPQALGQPEMIYSDGSRSLPAYIATAPSCSSAMGMILKHYCKVIDWKPYELRSRTDGSVAVRNPNFHRTDPYLGVLRLYFVLSKEEWKTKNPQTLRLGDLELAFEQPVNKD